MLTSPDGPFINISRLNFSKYAEIPTLAKALFEYIFYHENDIRNALQLASMATEVNQYDDWWWKIQLGKCYYRLGLFRDAEKQYLSALKQHSCVDSYLYISKVYAKLDQPLNSINKLKEANQRFPFETTILQGIARIHEGLGNVDDSTNYYKEVLHSDNTNVEAIASIATNHFYNDQPEVALKFYRRLLQMGVCNSELFNNIGLCCFYAQQYDMILSCFDRAISLANNDLQLTDIWFNLGHVAFGIGDSSLAYQCFRIALVHNNDNAEAYNNLGVLEMAHNRNDLAKSFFQASQSLGPMMFEPSFNNGYLAYKMGDLQGSFHSLKKSNQLFPSHASTKELLKELNEQFSVL
jgi:tetratricopeptide repeat protein 8